MKKDIKILNINREKTSQDFAKKYFDPLESVWYEDEFTEEFKTGVVDLGQTIMNFKNFDSLIVPKNANAHFFENNFYNNANNLNGNNNIKNSSSNSRQQVEERYFDPIHNTSLNVLGPEEIAKTNSDLPREIINYREKSFMQEMKQKKLQNGNMDFYWDIKNNIVENNNPIFSKNNHEKPFHRVLEEYDFQTQEYNSKFGNLVHSSNNLENVYNGQGNINHALNSNDEFGNFSFENQNIKSQPSSVGNLNFNNPANNLHNSNEFVQNENYNLNPAQNLQSVSSNDNEQDWSEERINEWLQEVKSDETLRKKPNVKLHLEIENEKNDLQNMELEIEQETHDLSYLDKRQTYINSEKINSENSLTSEIKSDIKKINNPVEQAYKEQIFSSEIVKQENQNFNMPITDFNPVGNKFLKEEIKEPLLSENNHEIKKETTLIKNKLLQNEKTEDIFQKIVKNKENENRAIKENLINSEKSKMNPYLSKNDQLQKENNFDLNGIFETQKKGTNLEKAGTQIIIPSRRQNSADNGEDFRIRYNPHTFSAEPAKKVLDNLQNKKNLNKIIGDNDIKKPIINNFEPTMMFQNDDFNNVVSSRRNGFPSQELGFLNPNINSTTEILKSFGENVNKNNSINEEYTSDNFDDFQSWFSKNKTMKKIKKVAEKESKVINKSKNK